MTSDPKNDTHRSKDSSIRILFLAIPFLSAVAAVCFIALSPKIHAYLDPETFKTTYQFLLVSVIGSSLPLLFQIYSMDKAREDEHRKLLHQSHIELLAAYNSVKKIRRTLRALCGPLSDNVRSGSNLVGRSDYEIQMQLLIETQLTFETHAKLAEDGLLFSSPVHGLAKNLRRIEEYLNAIITEYTERLATMDLDSPAIPLNQLARLEEFIGLYAKACLFRNEFTKPFNEVPKALHDARLF